MIVSCSRVMTNDISNSLIRKWRHHFRIVSYLNFDLHFLHLQPVGAQLLRSIVPQNTLHARSATPPASGEKPRASTSTAPASVAVTARLVQHQTFFW